MVGRVLLVLLLAAAVAALAIGAEQPRGVLRLCADPDNLPFSSAGGPDRGYYIDVGALVAGRLGMAVEVTWWPTYHGRRAVRNTLLADTCDVYVGLPYGVGYMERQVALTRPLLEVGYVIMAPPSLSFARLDDLKAHRLAVEFGTPPQLLLAARDGFRVSTFRSTQEAVDALGRREVDAAFVWGPVAGYLNATKLGRAYRIVAVAGEGMQWRVSIGVRKRDEMLRRRIDEALEQLEPDIRRAAEHYGFPLAAVVDLGVSVPAVPPATAPPEPTSTTANPLRGRAEAVAAGRSVFNQLCSHCHSPNAQSPEPSRDLRRLRGRYGERMTAVFYQTVTEGRSARGMPPWKEILKLDDIWRVLTFLESVQSPP